MNHVKTDLVTIEAAEIKGVRAAPWASVYSLVEKMHVPTSIHAGNARSFHHQDETFLVEGVVVAKPLEWRQRMFLVEAAAPLVGFYNAAPDTLCAAYGEPRPIRAWKVQVGNTISPRVTSAPAVHYEAVVAHLIEEVKDIENGGR